MSRRRIPASTEQHKAAARRLLTMRRELRQVFYDLGVSERSPRDMPSVTAKETDALLALNRAIERCASILNTRMAEDNQEPSDWDYYDAINEPEEVERTEPTSPGGKP